MGFWGDKYENLEPLHLGKNGEILQFFTAIKNQEFQAVFVVNHQVFPSATSAIMADRKAGLDVPEFDYIRSATREEAALFMELDSADEALDPVKKVDKPDEGISVPAQNKVDTTVQVTSGAGILTVLLSYIGLVPADIISFIKTYGAEVTLIGLGTLFVLYEIVKNLRKDK